MTPQFERLLDDKEAGDLLGLHPKTIQKMARDGEIPAIRIGRYWRFKVSLLNQWVEQKTRPAAIQCASQPARVGI